MLRSQNQLPGDTVEGLKDVLLQGCCRGCAPDRTPAPARLHCRHQPAVTAPTLRNALPPPLQCSLPFSATPPVEAGHKTPLGFPDGPQSLAAHTPGASSGALPRRRRAEHRCSQTQFSGGSGHASPVPTACCMLSKSVKS